MNSDVVWSVVVGKVKSKEILCRGKDLYSPAETADILRKEGIDVDSEFKKCFIAGSDVNYYESLCVACQEVLTPLGLKLELKANLEGFVKVKVSNILDLRFCRCDKSYSREMFKLVKFKCRINYTEANLERVKYADLVRRLNSLVIKYNLLWYCCKGKTADSFVSYSWENRVAN